MAAVHPEAMEIVAELGELANPQRAAGSARYFQTGSGGYGEGDRFVGLAVPDTRAICKRHPDLALEAIDDLLGSEWHEHRLAAVIMMGERYRRGDQARQAEIYDL